MDLFDAKGCLTDEGLEALIGGRLDELSRLEAAEHLSFCDRCLDRYTALLTPEVLETPTHSVAMPVIRAVWVRVMQTTWGRGAVAGIAAVLALTFWSSGVFQTPENLRVHREQQTAVVQQQEDEAEQEPQQGLVRRTWEACQEIFTWDNFSGLFQHNGGQ